MYAGAGQLFQACYSDVNLGIAIEKNDEKVDIVARQRPTWSVFQGDCVAAVEAGIAKHLKINLIDIDPYGSPFEAIEAALSHARLADRVQLVVNDGLRIKTKVGQSWSVGCLADVVERFGNSIYGNYLECARFKVESLARAAGFSVENWIGYYCGHAGDMSHYLPTLVRV
jgi:hypothetical protein